MTTLTQIHNLRRSPKAAHRGLRIVGIVVALLGFITALVLFLPKPQPSPAQHKVAAIAAAPKTSIPHHLVIPAIGVDAAIVSLGTDQDGELEAPKDYSTVGWYRESVQPGQIGAAVMDGHLDSATGPAVFENLNKLKAGDQIQIIGQNRETLTFTVESGEKYAQNNFPTEKVYGSIDYPGLRLITCAGTFNRSQQRYSDNFIIYARLTTQ